jgi:uncharacterized protein YoaH (UPF0181 family)
MLSEAEMATNPTSQVEEGLDRLEKEAVPPDSDSLAQIVKQLAQLFRVAEDEVAIMEIARSGRTLRFVVPEKLRQVGSIPLSSTSALAARTARERRSDIINNFSASRHASVFEGVHLGQRDAEAIQKIMSVPILRGNAVIGVAQICRKGVSTTDAGADFTSKDLSELTGLNQVLGRFLALCREN